MHSKVMKAKTLNISFGFLYLDHLLVELPVRLKINRIISILITKIHNLFSAGLTYLFLVQAHWPSEENESKRSTQSQVADVNVEMTKQDQLEAL